MAENIDDIVFNIVNQEAIDRLIADGEIILPKKKVAVSKDEQWNNKQMTSKVLRGIQNGDSIPKIAKSMMDTVGNNKFSAIRNARTMVTSAENHGRLDSFKNLSNQGVVMKKEWEATPDDRTRPTHVDIDGEEQDIDKVFSNGCMFPGDGKGPAEEVWMCRCAMGSHIIGFKRSDGSVSKIEYGRDRTTHDDQMQDEKNRRKQQEEKVQSKIIFSEKITDNTKNIILDLESEYNTRLTEVKTGAEKAAGDVDITGNTMRISSQKEETIFHEFAHTLANADADKYGLTDNKEFWKEIKKIRKEYVKDVGFDTSRWISSYEHSNKSIDEFMAEAFTMAKMKEMGYSLPEKYGNDFKYANKVLNIINKYFKKR